MKKNVALLYGFSFFDQLMIVIALWIPYFTTQGDQHAANLAVAARHPRLLLSPGSLRGLWIDVWGLPSVLSMLGILFSIAFVGLLLPLILRETARSPEPAPRLP